MNKIDIQSNCIISRFYEVQRLLKVAYKNLFVIFPKNLIKIKQTKAELNYFETLM